MFVVRCFLWYVVEGMLMIRSIWADLELRSTFSVPSPVDGFIMLLSCEYIDSYPIYEF